MNINPLGFLWLEEEKLVLFLIKAQEEVIAWILPSMETSGRITSTDYHNQLFPICHGSSTTFLYPQNI